MADLEAAAQAAEAALAGTAPETPAAPAAGAGSQPASGAPAAPQTPPPASLPASGQPSAATPAPAGMPAEEPKFEIKVDGKTELLTRAELIARAQMGTSFTKKSQTLAEERKRFEQDRQTILEQERTKWLQEQQEAARKAAAEGKTPAEQALERTQALEMKIEDERLEMVTNNVLAKHPGLTAYAFQVECVRRGLRDSEDVKAHGETIAAEMEAAQNGAFDSRLNEVLSKGEHPALKTFREQVIAEYLKSKGAGPAPVTTGSGTTPALGGAPKKIQSLDEAADVAMEMLGAKPV